MSVMGQVKDFFKKGKKKKVVPVKEYTDKQKKANPTNIGVGVRTIQQHANKRRAALKDIMDELRLKTSWATD